MTFTESVARVLGAPAETTSLDFKEIIDWASTRARLELAKDIVALANRDGGSLIVGVADEHGAFVAKGLPEGTFMPDPTLVGQVLTRYFDPPPSFEVRQIEVEERRFGVIEVREFSRVPHVCTDSANDQENRLVLRKGAVYRRNDAMQSTEIASAAEMQSLIEKAVLKTGAGLAALFPPVTRATPTEDDGPLVAADAEASRICNLEPMPVPTEDLTTLQLLERLQECLVRHRHGSVAFPRGIDPNALTPSQIVREPGRVLIERLRDVEHVLATTSAIELTSKLRVRVREVLWEEEGRLDYSSTMAFVLAALKFTSCLYGDTDIERVRIRIGVAQVRGRVLVDDPRRFTGFRQAYTATSERPLVATRTIDIAGLVDTQERLRDGRSIVEELGGYFGFRLPDAAWEPHVAYVNENVPGVAS